MLSTIASFVTVWLIDLFCSPAVVVVSMTALQYLQGLQLYGKTVHVTSTNFVEIVLNPVHEVSQSVRPIALSRSLCFEFLICIF